jgi:GrpB-like predicted nucleotidyltransferase (UPF0157 family)
MRTIRVVDYDPEWPNLFARLRERIWLAISDFAIGIEHVGSTSVPGLAAKAVIDIDIIVASRQEIPLAVTRLASQGYRHVGDLGIADREAFDTPSGSPAHNLYACPSESLALRNHLTLRDHLRAHPPDVAAYSALKMKLAREFPHDIARYVEAKSDFILKVLARQGFSPESVDSIRSANRKAEAPAPDQQGN